MRFDTRFHAFLQLCAVPCRQSLAHCQNYLQGPLCPSARIWHNRCLCTSEPCAGCQAHATHLLESQSMPAAASATHSCLKGLSGTGSARRVSIVSQASTLATLSAPAQSPTVFCNISSLPLTNNISWPRVYQGCTHVSVVSHALAAGYLTSLW